MTKTTFLIILLLAACGSVSLGEDLADGPDAAADPGVADGGDGTGDVEDYVSGDRIKARVLTTPDGARVLDGWRDTLLGVDCFFVDYGDGVKRCYPMKNAAFHGTYYANAECVEDVSSFPTSLVPCGTLPLYSVGSVAPQCNEARLEYTAVIAQITPTQLFIKINDQCVVATMPADTIFYSLGADVPLSTFQNATVSIE